MRDAVSGHMALARSALEEGTVLQGHGCSADGVLDRARVAMINAAWAMVLKEGEAINTHEDVIPALTKRLGGGSLFYGFITGTNDLCERIDFGPPVSPSSLKVNAQEALQNASAFIEMADRFIQTGDGPERKRIWNVVSVGEGCEGGSEGCADS